MFTVRPNIGNVTSSGTLKAPEAMPPTMFQPVQRDDKGTLLPTTVISGKYRRQLASCASVTVRR